MRRQLTLSGSIISEEEGVLEAADDKLDTVEEASRSVSPMVEPKGSPLPLYPKRISLVRVLSSSIHQGATSL